MEMQSAHSSKSSNSCRKYFSSQKPFAFETQEHSHNTWDFGKEKNLKQQS